jgi:hypothetical protein
MGFSASTTSGTGTRCRPARPGRPAAQLGHLHRKHLDQRGVRTEAFQFLEARLREAALTVPVSGGLEWWPWARPADHPDLPVVQVPEEAVLRLLRPGPAPEGLGLLGMPSADV